MTETLQPKFALADLAGKIRIKIKFRGRHLLVFFGFTNCPNICQTTLNELTQIINDLGDLAGKVQPQFIFVDPTVTGRLALLSLPPPSSSDRHKSAFMAYLTG
ncbi:MAG: SCO family protein [Notoacmeibacter sp.]